MLNFSTCLIIMLTGTIVSGFSQTLLKIAANKKYNVWYKQYLNFRVIIAYGLFFVSTLLSVIAYKVLPLSMSPIWVAAEQIVTFILSVFILKEKPNKKKLIGFSVIIAGIILFCINF